MSIWHGLPESGMLPASSAQLAAYDDIIAKNCKDSDNGFNSCATDQIIYTILFKSHLS